MTSSTSTHINIWEQFNAELKRFICRKVGHDDDHCEDILQELYLKIFINIGKVSEARNIRSYVFQMAHNAVMDHYRRTIHNAPLADKQLSEPGGEEMLLKTEYHLAECLRPMINTLPEIYRQALILVELEGLTQKEFAERTGISLSGAKSRVQRAREKLKEEIMRCCEYEFDKYGNIVSCCKSAPPGKKYQRCQ